MTLAPFVEMTILNSILAVNISAVGVATSPGQLMRSPPNVNMVWLDSLVVLCRQIFYS